MPKKGGKTNQIRVRLTDDLKEKLQRSANGNGVTLTKLILTRATGGQVRDRTFDDQLFNCIRDFTHEINKIGTNINQVTIAIHQINHSQKIEQGELREFNKLLESYLSKRDPFKDILTKAFFYELGV